MKTNRLITTVLTTLAILFAPSLSHAKIIETANMRDVAKYTYLLYTQNPEDSLILFNIAEVLTDSTISLGTQPSRKYLKAMAKKMQNPPECDVHDALTWLIFNKVPHKSVESPTPRFIQSLQDKGVAVAALTSRGRSEWYSTQLPGVDIATEEMLYSLGYDLRRSPPPIMWAQVVGNEYAAHFRNGIYYCNHMDKGAFLKHIFETTRYRPKYVVVIDDKRESLEEIEEALSDSDSKFGGIWYNRTAQDHADFNKMVCVLQLKQLIESGTILSDAEAEELAATTYLGVDPDALCVEILDSMDFSDFPPK